MTTNGTGTGKVTKNNQQRRTSTPISRSDVRKATINAERKAKSSDRALLLSPGQARFITRHA